MQIPQERRLATEIPGPRSRELLARRERAIPRGVFNVVPIFARAASGAIVEDVDGNRLIDFGSGISTLNVGNASPPVVAAIGSQAERTTHTCFHVTMNEPYLELAERLNGLAPGDQEKQTMLVSSGAEAVENAVKIARYATGRPAVVTFEHAFHGRTLLAMSLTGKVMPYKHGFGPFTPDVHRLPFSYPYRCPAGEPPERCGPACAARAVDVMQHHIGPGNIACIVVEPVLGEGGFVVPAPEFLPALRAFADEHEILLVADEVQTAFGRTGRWWAVEHVDVIPDIVATAKSLGGGLPLGSVTGPREVMDAVHVGGLGGTFGGNPVAAAAALAVIEQIEAEGLLERAHRLGKTMIEHLRGLGERFEAVGDVRGIGAMVAMELVQDRGEKTPARDLTAALLAGCHERGLILLKAGTYDNVVRLLPPLTIEEGLLEEGLGIVEEVLEGLGSE